MLKELLGMGRLITREELNEKLNEAKLEYGIKRERDRADFEAKIKRMKFDFDTEEQRDLEDFEKFNDRILEDYEAAVVKKEIKCSSCDEEDCDSRVTSEETLKN